MRCAGFHERVWPLCCLAQSLLNLVTLCLRNSRKSAKTRLSNWRTAEGATSTKETIWRWCLETATRPCNLKATHAQAEIRATCSPWVVSAESKSHESPLE